MTLLHQAAQKAVEARLMNLADEAIHAYAGWLADFIAGDLPSPHTDRLNAEKDAAREKLRLAIVSALQQQPEPVARSAHMCGMQGFDGMLDICPACEARRAPPALQHQEVPREPAYESTDLTDGIAIAGMSLADGDKRLVALLLTAFGPKHPAIDDLVALLFRARSAASPSTPAREEAGVQKAQDPYGY